MRKAVAKNESLADVEQIKVYSRSSELTIVAVEVQMPLTEGKVRNRCEQLDSKFESGAPRISEFPVLAALVLGKAMDLSHFVY